MKTDPRFWDCECPENYIHPKSETSCLECNANSDDQPDSMIAEILKTNSTTTHTTPHNPPPHNPKGGKKVPKKR